jgi:hypothetical protein
MENLLAMPVRPIEVMLAKIVPYFFVGYIQVVLILTVSTQFLRAAGPGLGGVPPCRFGPVHRQQSRAWDHVFDSRSNPDTGDPVCTVYPSAVDSAFGFHVPVQGHAGLGAMGWRNHSRDARDAGRARPSAQGKSTA